MVGRALFLLRRQAAAVGVVDFHAEAAGACGHRPPDPSHAQDAEAFAADVRAAELRGRPAGPAALAQQALGLPGAPRRAEQAEQSDVGRRIGQHVRRVADLKSARLGGRQIDVLVADREGRQQLDACGQAFDQRAIEAVAGDADDREAVLGRRDDLIGTQNPIRRVQASEIVARQAVGHRGGQGACGEDAKLLGHDSKLPRRTTRTVGWRGRLKESCRALCCSEPAAA